MWEGTPTGINEDGQTTEPWGTHQTSTSTKSRTSGEGVQARDDGLKPLHQFGIAVSEFMKCFCLFLEYSED